MAVIFSLYPIQVLSETFFLPVKLTNIFKLFKLPRLPRTFILF